MIWLDNICLRLDFSGGFLDLSNRMIDCAAVRTAGMILLLQQSELGRIGNTLYRNDQNIDSQGQVL